MLDVHKDDPVRPYGPSEDGEEVDVSASDQTLSRPSTWIWVGTLGDLDVTLKSGKRLTYPSVVGVIPCRVIKIHNAGTTASGIVANW